jgi:hypothetical protein
MLRTKSDVRFEVITPALLLIMGALDRISREARVDIYITAGTDGKHMPNSKHYTGEAVDVRVANLSPAQRELVVFELKQQLGPAYDVILEKNPPHIHVEYDPEKP